MTSRTRLVAQGVAIGLVVLLFILLAWSLATNKGGDLSKRANRGDRPTAPDFTLERLDRSGSLALSSLRGKAVVLNVWASWCIPCKEEAPYLEQVARARRSDVVVVGLDAKDFREDARRFASRYELTFPLVYDGPGKTLGGYGVTRLSGDVRDRPRRPRGACVRRGGERGRGARAASDRDRSGAVVKLALGLLVALLVLVSASAAGAASAEGRGPRVAAGVPRLRDDARPVERSDRPADEVVHPRTDCGGRQRAGDQGRARRAVRLRGAREAARRGLRTPRVVAPACRRGRRRGRRRPSDPGLEPSGSRRRGRSTSVSILGSSASSTRSSRASTGDVSWASIPVAFLAGMVSFLAPCVLPLVPAYLSAVSAVDADRLGQRGTARRVVASSLPFVAGFTAVLRPPRHRARRSSEAGCWGISSCSSAWPGSSSSSSASRSWGCCRGRSASSEPVCCRKHAAADRVSCSAVLSRSAPRRASGPCSPRSSSSPAPPTRSCREPRCSPSTPSASPCPSCWPRRSSRARCRPFAGSATTTARSRSAAVRSWSRSGCSCSSSASTSSAST